MKNIFIKLILVIFILFIITFINPIAMAVKYDVELEKYESKVMMSQTQKYFSTIRSEDYYFVNEALIEQNGNYNKAIINQFGIGNLAKIIQFGSKNVGEIIQDGNSNEAELFQRKEGGVPVKNTEAFIKQNGNYNKATIELTKDGEKDKIIQKGDSNSASTSIIGSGSVIIRQVGNQMNLKIDSLLGY